MTLLKKKDQILQSTNTLERSEKHSAEGIFEKSYERHFLWDDFDHILIFFFYCQSLFDCWKNQVIRGLKSHHKTFVNLTQGV